MSAIPCRPLAALVTALVLAGLEAMPVGAATGPSRVAAVTATGIPQLAALGSLDSLWSWLTRIWPEAGCIIDRNGGCAPAAVRGKVTAGTRRFQPDAGCGIDPNGGCTTGAVRDRVTAGAQRFRPDAGCGIDPDGGCTTGAVRGRVTAGAQRFRPDAGCTIDPDGACTPAASRPR
jgi:hypothetical protein